MEGDNELDARNAGGRVRFRVCFFEAVNGVGGNDLRGDAAHAGRREEQLWENMQNPAYWAI